MAVTPDTPLVPLQVNNAVPANFPATRGAVDDLSQTHIQQLLQDYGQQINGTPNARRRRLRHFIGT